MVPTCAGKNALSAALVEKRPNSCHGRYGIFFHNPMAGVWNDTLLDVVCGKAHDRSHRRTKRLLAAERQDWDLELAFAQERLVVDCVLVKCRKLRKARAHRAGTRIERRIVAPRCLAEARRR